MPPEPLQVESGPGLTGLIETDDTGHVDPRRAGSMRLRTYGGRFRLAKFGGIYLWILIVIVFALWIPDSFLSATTARSIAGDQGVTVIVALGLVLALSTGSYDLSIAQNLGFAAVLAAIFTSQYHFGLIVSLVLVLAVGLLIGVANGALVTLLGVSSFIATLGSSSILVAATGIATGYNFVGPVPAGDQDVVTAQPLGIPILALYGLGVGLIMWYALHHSPLGRRLQATGANPEAARLAGISTRCYQFLGLVASAIIGSLAGFLVALRVGSVSADIGPSYLLPAFAACFLGSTQIRPGRFNVWGTVVAIYLLATGVKGLQLLGGQMWITDLFNGVALLAAVSLAIVTERRQTRGGT